MQNKAKSSIWTRFLDQRDIDEVSRSRGHRTCALSLQCNHCQSFMEYFFDPKKSFFSMKMEWKYVKSTCNEKSIRYILTHTLCMNAI